MVIVSQNYVFLVEHRITLKNVNEASEPNMANKVPIGDTIHTLLVLPEQNQAWTNLGVEC